MGTMPDAANVPDDPDYRFVVLGHPELGEFLDWDAAVAAAWTATLPGAARAEVTLAHKGVQQVKTQDPEPEPEAEYEPIPEPEFWVFPKEFWNGISHSLWFKGRDTGTYRTDCEMVMRDAETELTTTRPTPDHECQECRRARGAREMEVPSSNRFVVKVCKSTGTGWVMSIKDRPHSVDLTDGRHATKREALNHARALLEAAEIAPASMSINDISKEFAWYEYVDGEFQPYTS